MTIEDLREFMVITINATAERLVLDVNEFVQAMTASEASSETIFTAIDSDLK